MRCKTCGYYSWEHGGMLDESKHRCPPRWDVWPTDESREDGADCIYAQTAEDAATKWGEVEDWRSAEYQIVGGRDAKVHVASYTDESILTFLVSGETVPEYYAHDITGKEEDAT